MEREEYLAKITDFWYGFKIDFLRLFLLLWGFFHVKLLLLVLAILNLTNWFFARFISVEIGFDKIALHYSVDFGIDLYGNTEKIFVLPFLGLMVIAFNFFLTMFLGKYLRADLKFISYVLLLCALVVSIVLLGATTSIYFINFR